MSNSLSFCWIANIKPSTRLTSKELMVFKSWTIEVVIRPFVASALRSFISEINSSLSSSYIFTAFANRSACFSWLFSLFLFCFFFFNTSSAIFDACSFVALFLFFISLYFFIFETIYAPVSYTHLFLILRNICNCLNALFHTIDTISNFCSILSNCLYWLFIFFMIP